MSPTYFAYGSNMKIERITKRAPSTRVSGRGRILNKQLTFNKISADDSGKANIVESVSNAVWGVLFEIDERDVPNLDNEEKGYKKLDVIVIDDSGNPVQAFTYVSTKTDNKLKPYDWYLSWVIQGAEENNLPKDYVEDLRKFASIPDARKQEEG